MVSAIEAYNKPDFKYREETFSILAINAWELLLKAKWLKDNGNKVRTLCVTEKRLRPNGKPYKHAKVKMTGAGNPFTHSLDYLAKRMAEKKTLADAAHKNIIALCEIRDSSVHFYNKSGCSPCGSKRSEVPRLGTMRRLHSYGSASIFHSTTSI